MDMDMDSQNQSASNVYDQQTNYCWYRLPCGLCQRTGQQCPKAYSLQGWTVTTATNAGNGG